MPRKAFTVDEANAMIPSLVEVFRGIEVEKRTIRELANKIDVLELLWGNALRDEDHPDHTEFAAHREGIDRSLLAIQQAVEEHIVARGMRFPAGGIEAGLVDFPTTYSGRWVFLCWKLGERQLTHWHEIDAGFQGRKKITEAQRRSMGEDDPDSIDDSALDA
jgi:hypothetical protein